MCVYKLHHIRHRTSFAPQRQTCRVGSGSDRWFWRCVRDRQTDRQTETHVVLQQDEHAPLCQLFGRDELVPGLSELLCRDFPPSSPLVVKVQATTVQLLQLVLKNQSEQRSETQTAAEHLDQNICSDSVPDAFWV